MCTSDPLNFYLIRLQMLKLHRSYPLLKRALGALGDAIAQACLGLDKLELRDLEEDQYEGILDMETSIIENLLGAAFVTCQAHISTIVTLIMELHTDVLQKESAPLRCCSKDKTSILGFGQLKVGNSEFSPVQVIDAAANYYKHSAEWIPFWGDLKGIQQRTANILMAVGASPGSTGNFRTISEALGNHQYENTMIFVDSVLSWHNQLESEHQKELKVRGLI